MNACRRPRNHSPVHCIAGPPRNSLRMPTAQQVRRAEPDRTGCAGTRAHAPAGTNRFRGADKAHFHLIVYKGSIRVARVVRLTCIPFSTLQGILWTVIPDCGKRAICISPSLGGRPGRRHTGPTAFVTPSVFHHRLATHLLEAGSAIRTVQELLGHASVETTMISTHVLNRGGRGVRSPLDGLGCANACRGALPG